MRVKVGKQSRKTLQYYRINFLFSEPYKLIVDGNFLKTCIDKKIELRTKMYKTLNGKCVIATTNCILRELQQLGENFRGISIAARRLPKEKCRHEGTVDPSECIKSIIGSDNADKVIIASQDQELVYDLRRIPGVPTIQITQGKIVINEPADEVKESLEQELKERGGVSEKERKILQPVIRKMKDDERKQKIDSLKKQRDKLGIKMKKKAKGPNPLAMKKKSKNQHDN